MSGEEKGRMYTWSGKKYDPPAFAEQLKKAKKEGRAKWWPHFSIKLTAANMVFLVCDICGKELSATNPSSTATDHLKTHDTRNPSVNASAESGAQPGSAAAAEPLSSKRARTSDGGRQYFPAASQLLTFLKNLALFFYSCNIALHLIEHPNLVAACAAVGVRLPTRKKLATTMLDEAYDEVVKNAEEAWFWKKAMSQHYEAIAEVADRLLRMHATTCAAERNWSLWGNVFSKARSRLGKERAEKLIFIRQNMAAMQSQGRGVLYDEEVVLTLLGDESEEVAEGGEPGPSQAGQVGQPQGQAGGQQLLRRTASGGEYVPETQY